MSPASKSNRAATHLGLPEIAVAGTPARRSVPTQALAPPGVGHLLLWTAGCACYLSVMQVLAGGSPSPRGMVLLVLQCFGSGAAIGCVLFTVVQRVRGIRLEWSPGHWLLLSLGVTLLTEASGLRAYPGAATMVTCWMLLLPTFSRKISMRWRVAFVCLVMWHALPLVLPMLKIHTDIFMVRPWLEPLVAALIVISVYLYERFRGVTHVWMHGVGIAVTVWNFLLWAMFRYVL